MGFTSKLYLNLIRQALREDSFRHDITSRILIPPKQKASAQIIAKEQLILCGIPLAVAVFKTVDSQLKIKNKFHDGQNISSGESILEIRGLARNILAAERVALNFLQRLCGIATLTRRFVDAIQGTNAKILDTRKTTPTFRSLERYAVAMGGGVNHRFDLSAAVMVKDNHRALVGDFDEVLRRLKNSRVQVPIIVEVESLDDLACALEAKISHIQLDNMSVASMKRAVKMAAGRAKLEATGGVNLKNIRKIADTGVDFISIGALTHSARAVDLSLEILV